MSPPRRGGRRRADDLDAVIRPAHKRRPRGQYAIGGYSPPPPTYYYNNGGTSP